MHCIQFDYDVLVIWLLVLSTVPYFREKKIRDKTMIIKVFLVSVSAACFSTTLL